MICSKCKNEGVLNHVELKPFYYCRTCKDEIKLEDFLIIKDNYTSEELEALKEFEALLNGGGYYAQAVVPYMKPLTSEEIDAITSEMHRVHKVLLDELNVDYPSKYPAI